MRIGLWFEWAMLFFVLVSHQVFSGGRTCGFAHSFEKRGGVLLERVGEIPRSPIDMRELPEFHRTDYVEVVGITFGPLTSVYLRSTRSAPFAYEVITKNLAEIELFHYLYSVGVDFRVSFAFNNSEHPEHVRVSQLQLERNTDNYDRPIKKAPPAGDNFDAAPAKILAIRYAPDLEQSTILFEHDSHRYKLEVPHDTARRNLVELARATQVEAGS